MRGQIIAVLLDHGVSRVYQGFPLVVELAELSLAPADALPTQIFDWVARQHGISRAELQNKVRQFARQMEKKDPEWFQAAVGTPFRAVNFIQAIAREAAAAPPPQ